MSGWIKLHRKIAEWEWYSDTKVRLLFFHLLLTVNHKPSRYCGKDVPAGAVVTGRHALAEAVGISPSSVVRCLNKLKSTQEVDIKTTNKFSIISIVNWEQYQSFEQQTDNNRTTTEQQPDTSKECKKERNIYTSGSDSQNTADEKFEEFWSTYPRRKGNPKKPAGQKFAAAVKRGVDPDQIIAGAEAYARSVSGKDPQFTAMATTWLNQERWSDCLDEEAAQVLPFRKSKQQLKWHPMLHSDLKIVLVNDLEMEIEHGWYREDHPFAVEFLNKHGFTLPKTDRVQSA